jgi:N-succinyldiaminopimelate aminotransferase
LVFHSLSKRSSAPGLRCGFVVGDPERIAALDGILRVGGAGVPLPVIAAGTRLWREEEHVAANRARYQENFTVAERVLGNRFGFRKPEGAFFLWLDVGDGEAAARTLWREAGIRVLPGAYMCQEGPDGENPGAPYIRVALVYDPALTEAALRRLAEVL